MLNRKIDSYLRDYYKKRITHCLLLVHVRLERHIPSGNSASPSKVSSR